MSGKTHPHQAMADDTRVTRARRSLPAVLAVLCLLLATPAYALNDTQKWGLTAIHAPDAWQLSSGAGVRVAVVDTGVDAAHEDLLGQILPGWGFDGSTDDSVGHGTEVAGVIAAIRDNGIGIDGVAPESQIVPIRAFASADDGIDVNAVVQALDQAGSSGAQVVNASFNTGPLSPRQSSWVEDKIDGVLAKYPATLFVTAAGNDDNDNDVHPSYPCAADASNLICVGSYGQDGKPAPDSNYGQTTVDLFAPGVSIYTTTITSPFYGFVSGTSFATPFVSGEAALLRSEDPALSPEQVKGLILNTTTSVSALSMSTSGGEPNADAAVQAAAVDGDGDGVPDAIDACPTQPYASPDGCAPPPPPPTPTPTPTAQPTVSPTPTPTPVATPVPTPVPQLRSLTATVRRCKSRKRCRPSATVKLEPDRAATIVLRVERHVCARRRCRWSAVFKRTVSAGTAGAKVTVRGSAKTGLKKGSYRVTAVPSSRAGAGRPATRTFRVR
jgi:Subtilase family